MSFRSTRARSTKHLNELLRKYVKLRIPKIFPTEVLRMALDSVRSNKFRSFLTVLGIVIGVFTAIVVASILTGMRQSLVAMIEDYGTNNIYAFHLTTGPRTNTDRAERLRKPLTIRRCRSDQGPGIRGRRRCG